MSPASYAIRTGRRPYAVRRDIITGRLVLRHHRGRPIITVAGTDGAKLDPPRWLRAGEGSP